MSACVLLACPAAPAEAQSNASFTPELVQSVNPNSAQREQIQQIADESMRQLESGDPIQMRGARTDLRVALRDPQASPAFRNIVGQQLNARLTEMAGSPEERSVVTALHVSGYIATNESVDLLDRMLDDGRETMRYVAAFGYDAAFQTLRGAPALSDQRVRRMIERLGDRVRREPQPAVLDMSIRAMLTAMQAGSEISNTALRDNAMSMIVKACGDRVRELDPNERALLAPMLKAAQAVRNELQVLDARLPREAVREAGGFCGDMIAFVFRSVRAKALPTVDPGAGDAERDAALAQRGVCVTALSLAQSTIPLAKDALSSGGPNDPMPQNLDNLIRQATRDGDEEFAREALDVIGDGGILTSGEFDFLADRFLK